MKIIDLDGIIRESKFIKKVGNQFVVETIEHGNKVIYGVNDEDIIDTVER